MLEWSKNNCTVKIHNLHLIVPDFCHLLPKFIHLTLAKIILFILFT